MSYKSIPLFTSYSIPHLSDILTIKTLPTKHITVTTLDGCLLSVQKSGSNSKENDWAAPTSSAVARAVYGHCLTPVTDLAFSCRSWETAISTAPPPATREGSRARFRATPKASWRLRSTSFRMSLLGPRRRMVHALGSLHSVMKVKYSSPICWERDSCWYRTSKEQIRTYWGNKWKLACCLRGSFEPVPFIQYSIVLQ